MIDLLGKTALVTGGTGGIGSEICRTLAKAGASVIVGYNSNIKKGNELAGEIGVLSLKIDVTSEDDISILSLRLPHSVAGLDILVNNAGINIPSPFSKITNPDWDRVIATNLTGVFKITQATEAVLNDGASIINIGSVSGFIGGPTSSHYAASKGGLKSLTENIALSMVDRNIRCNMVAPGYIESEMAARGAVSSDVAKTIERIPLGRMGTFQEVANCVAFLASDLSSYITAQTLHVNGGLYF